MKPSKFDNKIKAALTYKTQNINTDDEMLNEIKNKINQKPIGGLNMKKKIIAISAACILCFATMTCVASMKAQMWVSHSYATDELSEFPTEKQIEKRAGFSPKYVKELNDNYSFLSANFSESSALDADGKSLLETTNVNFRYTDGTEAFENGKKSLMLIAENIPEDMVQDGSDIIDYDVTEYNGISMKYTSFKSIFLPPSYEGKDITDELTEEEKELKEQGRLNIAYGSSDIMRNESQTLRWYEDGIGYMIMATDCSLNQEEMLEMAKNVINK